jgi:hypothetical protein
MMLLSSLVRPPDSLEIPPDPKITSFTITEHRDFYGDAVTGQVFSVKELDSVPAIAADEEAVVMSAVTRS